MGSRQGNYIWYAFDVYGRFYLVSVIFAGKEVPTARKEVPLRKYHWGACRPPNPPASLRGAEGLPRPLAQGARPPSCAQARMARTAREHERLMARYMFRVIRTFLELNRQPHVLLPSTMMAHRTCSMGHSTCSMAYGP